MTGYVPGDAFPEDERLEHDLMAGATIAMNAQHVAPAAEIGLGLKNLQKINRTGQGNPQKAGFRAEVHHEATFNADATRKGLTVRAHRTTGGAAADLNVTQGDVVVARVQVKNCKTVARTTKAISAKKYDGMKKVVPADQADGVRGLASRRGVDGLGQSNYADTSQNTSARVEHGDAASRPLSYEQAQSRNMGARLVTGEMGQAARSGAQGGAVIGGAISMVSNIAAVTNGDKSALEAAGAVARDATLAAAGGAVSAAMTTAVTAGCTRVGLKVLSRGGAPGALAATGIEVGKDMMAWAKGDLSGLEVAGRGLEHAGGAGGAWGGATAGAALGTAIFPGVGTVIGGLLGGMAGNAGARKAIQGLKAWFS
ncbi:hypothetical protein [Deinococcus sp. AJ005]|uniref:hypothetical protein n=1 Tax=Deinococcus sp. AJ005 TaxID=2652443 RepID=UPI00125CCA8B|nr:hypothetical protein [Deinococcus sp. AJ005]QFP75034.1 hypothetical protein DAAJ005_00265 [Deinococcus sp. AJ005]